MPDTEITRAETGERARLLLVRSCDVDWDFTQGPDTFGSVSLIPFNADCALESVFRAQVTTPAGWVVPSNQPQADIERTLHDSRTVRFHPTPSLQTAGPNVARCEFPGQATEARSLLEAERALRTRGLLKNRD